MKKKTTVLLLMLTFLFIAAFMVYRVRDTIRTDTQAPEITLGAVSPEVSVTDPQEALLEGVTATDKQDGDVTASLVIENISLLDNTGRISVSYAAFDNAGNVVKAQQEARYTDYVSPRFTLSAPLLYQSGNGFDVLTTIGATDMVDGNIQHRIRATSLDNATITTPGTHDVQFQVTNSLGDTVTIVLPVEVYDPNTYPAKLTLNNYLVYLNTGASFQPASYLDRFQLSGTTTPLNGQLPSGYSLQTVGEVPINTPGAYTVQYLVTHEDILGRTYTGYSKLVVIVEG